MWQAPICRSRQRPPSVAAELRPCSPPLLPPLRGLRPLVEVREFALHAGVPSVCAEEWELGALIPSAGPVGLTPALSAFPAGLWCPGPRLAPSHRSAICAGGGVPASPLPALPSAHPPLGLRSAWPSLTFAFLWTCWSWVVTFHAELCQDLD